MNTAITKQLLEFISEDLVDDQNNVSKETELLLSGMVDSLGVLQIVGFLEAELDIAIDPGDVLLENFQSVAAIVAFVDSHRSSNAGA